MRTDFKWPLRLSQSAALLLVYALTNTMAPAQNWSGRGPWQASGFLHAEHLQEAGLHLPSYVSDIGEQVAYQTKLSTHQEFVVQWDSIPGRTEVMDYKEAENIQVAPQFVLKDRGRNLRGGIGLMSKEAINSLVIAGVNANGEIRGLQVLPDPRLIWGEGDALFGDKRGRPARELLQPCVTLRFRMPDDPQIKSILFFSSTHREEGGAKLVRIGSVDLQNGNSTGPAK